MYFANLSDLVAMGGHGFYVWLAYGFSIFWIAYLLLRPLSTKSRLLEEIRQQQQLEAMRNKFSQ